MAAVSRSMCVSQSPASRNAAAVHGSPSSSSRSKLDVQLPMPLPPAPPRAAHPPPQAGGARPAAGRRAETNASPSHSPTPRARRALRRGRPPAWTGRAHRRRAAAGRGPQSNRHTSTAWGPRTLRKRLLLDRGPCWPLVKPRQEQPGAAHKGEMTTEEGFATRFEARGRETCRARTADCQRDRPRPRQATRVGEKGRRALPMRRLCRGAGRTCGPPGGGGRGARSERISVESTA